MVILYFLKALFHSTSYNITVVQWCIFFSTKQKVLDSIPLGFQVLKDVSLLKQEEETGEHALAVQC